MFPPKHLPFVRTSATLSALMGGFGSAKTTTGALRAILYALTFPGSMGLVAAPTYPMLRDGTQREYLRWLPDEARADFNKSEHHLTLTNGSEVLFRSVDDPDSVRSLNLAYFFLDEAQKASHEAWLNLIARIRQPGYPQQGWAAGTHQGNDWTIAEFEADGHAGPDERSIVKEPEGVRMALWHVASADNPFLPAHYVPMLKARYKGAWAAQGIEGGHGKFEGLIYGKFERSVHVVAEVPKLKRVALCVDWGYHYAPIYVIGVTHDDQVVVADEWYVTQVTPTEQYAAAKELAAKWNARIFYADPSRPENIIEMQRATRMTPPEYEPGKVEEGLAYGNALLDIRRDGKPGLVVHKSCVNWIAEAESYIWAPRPKVIAIGAEWKDKPAEGQLDHAMDATRYGWMGLRIAEAVSGSAEPDDYYRVRRGGGFGRGV